jgi:hypothetical protein
MLMQLGPRVTVERIVAEGQDLGQPDRAAVAWRILKRYGE